MIEVLDNLFDDYFNDYLIRGLYSVPGWRICSDAYYESKDENYNKFSDTGHVLRTYGQGIDQVNHKLNAYADLILDKVIATSKYEYQDISVVRYFWNYYSRSSTGLSHKDIYNDPDNFASIVYNISNSDGATIVADQRFETKPGRAIIFDSKETHRGVGPSLAQQRFVLNIIFRYTNRFERPNDKTNRIRL